MTTVLTERRDAVAVLTLNRPERKNAMNAELREDFSAALADVGRDRGVRVVVLTGAGGAFCAGGDITTMGDLTPISARERMRKGGEVARALALLEVPVIAAVEGPAVGAGLGLVCLCDFAIAGRGALFMTPFVKLGLVPDYGLLHTLPKRVGLSLARRMMYRSIRVDGPRALEAGLVDELVDDGAALDAALALATELAAGPRHAFTVLKRGLALDMAEFERTLDYEALAQASCMAGAEFAEGRASFLEKRKPSFP